MAKNKKSKKDSIEEIKKEQISKKDEVLAKLEKEILFLIPYKRSNWFGVSLSFNIF